MCEFKPNKIVTNFEKGLKNACMLQWPKNKLDGCRFLFITCIVAHNSKTWACNWIKNDKSETSKWLHYFLDWYI